MLRCFPNHRLFSLVFVLSISSAAFAVVESDALLPATTKGYISVTNSDTLEANWRQTMFGQLARDESMKPFVDDLTSQIQRRGADIRAKVGVSLQEIAEVASGEVSLSMVLASEREAPIVLTADVTGKLDDAQTVLGKIAHNMSAQKAKTSTTLAHGVDITVHVLPPDEKTTREQRIVVFLHDNILCATNHLGVAQGIAGRLSGNASDSLRTTAAYQATMGRCKSSAGAMTPDIRWFVDPFGYVTASRIAKENRAQQHGRDLAAILKRQGFDAIEGVGGYLHFYVNGDYELLHRTAVYVPSSARSDSGKRAQAMRMLETPAEGDLTPQAWIPRGVATYASFNWDIKKAFDNASSLVDEFIGEEGFEDVMRGIREREFGPHVDVRNDIIEHLGKRITVITDYVVPITTDSEHFLFAVETKNSEKLSEAIDKLMEHDPNAVKREHEGHLIWEIVEETMEVPEIEIEGEIEGIFDPLDTDEKAAEKEKPTFPNSCVCVIDGRLLFASNMDFLKTVLSRVDEGQTLQNSPDFNLVRGTLDRLRSDELCMRSFSRTDEEYRPTYELLRQGKMPQSETLLGRILNEMLTEDEEEVRQQRFDGSKLPNFEMVRRYFGPAGITMTPETDGWFVVGVMLRKDMPIASQTTPAETVKR